MSNNYKKSFDERGILYAINSLNEFLVKRLYLIEPKQEVWRGKHYHKCCKQFIILLNGKLTCKTIDINNNVKTFEMLPGSTYYQDIGNAFCFKSVSEDTKILVLCDKEFDKNDYYEVCLNDE